MLNSDPRFYYEYITWFGNRVRTLPPERVPPFVNEALGPFVILGDILKTVPKLKGNLFTVGIRVVGWVKAMKNPSGNFDPLYAVREQMRETMRNWSITAVPRFVPPTVGGEKNPSLDA